MDSSEGGVVGGPSERQGTGESSCSVSVDGLLPCVGRAKARLVGSVFRGLAVRLSRALTQQQQHKKARKERQAERESARVVNRYTALCTLCTARPTHETFLPCESVPVGVWASSGECCGTAAVEEIRLHSFRSRFLLSS